MHGNKISIASLSCQTMPRSNNSTSYEARQKQLVQDLLLEAAERCMLAKRGNDGKLPHGCMNKVLADIGCPELNRDKVNYMIKRLESESESKIPETPIGVGVVDDASTTNISQLTSPSMLSQLTDDTDLSSGQNQGGRPKAQEKPSATIIKARKLCQLQSLKLQVI